MKLEMELHNKNTEHLLQNFFLKFIMELVSGYHWQRVEEGQRRKIRFTK